MNKKINKVLLATLYLYSLFTKKNKVKVKKITKGITIIMEELCKIMKKVGCSPDFIYSVRSFFRYQSISNINFVYQFEIEVLMESGITINIKA